MIAAGLHRRILTSYPSSLFRSSSAVSSRQPWTLRCKAVESTPGFLRLSTTKSFASEARKQSTGVDKLPLKNQDPDTFGTLAIGKSGIEVKDEAGIAASQELLELEEQVESVYTPTEADDQVFKPDHPWTMDRLRRKVFELLREKKLKEALDTYTFVIQDGGFPFHQGEMSFICSALISACAGVGHVDMAFKLFDDMKRRGATMKPGWYTSLFNACANSPWDAKRNLARIERLRDHMVYKGIEPNETHYHAMIKAYGRCGALEAAFSVVDDMRSSEGDEKIRISPTTFSFLLQACIGDRENGFRHAVVTFDKMMKMKIRPDIFIYNLFIRAIRECSIQLPKKEKGTPKLADDSDTSIKTTEPKLKAELVQPLPGKLKENLKVMELILLNEEDSLRIAGQETYPIVQRTNKELEAVLSKPENRLALLGGLRAITTQMNIHNVKPDLKTATELVLTVSPDELPDVLMFAETHKLKPDIHFFNMMMKKYIQWRQGDKARQVLQTMGNHHLIPNIVTWGILSVGAEKWSDAAKLLREMDALGITPNDNIMGGFLSNAIRGYDPRYIVRLLEEHVRRELTPSPRFVAGVEKFQAFVRKAILDVEKGRELESPRLKAVIQTENFNEYWIKLNLRFESWVKQVGVREEEVPWKKDYEERTEMLKTRKSKDGY